MSEYLFVDFSSAFNTMSPMKLIGNINTLDLSTLKLKKHTEYWTSSQDNLYVNAQHRSTPGLCAHSPAVHTVHPWLHFQTSWGLYCEVCGRHHNHQTHSKQWWDFILGANQRTIYCSVSKLKSWREAKTHTSVYISGAEVPGENL